MDDIKIRAEFHLDRCTDGARYRSKHCIHCRQLSLWKNEQNKHSRCCDSHKNLKMCFCCLHKLLWIQSQNICHHTFCSKAWFYYLELLNSYFLKHIYRHLKCLQTVTISFIRNTKGTVQTNRANIVSIKQIFRMS